MSPTQVQRRAVTSAALLDAARTLFAENGYAVTSLHAVATRAGLTKGAIYHHFTDKRELFEAVFVGEVAELTRSLIAAYARVADPWDALEAGCQAFLAACLDPQRQRIVLLDGFAALGWEQVRGHEAGLLDGMEQAISRAITAQRIAPRPPRPLATLLFGGLCEMAMAVARADDQPAAADQARGEIARTMRALATEQAR